MPTKWVSCDADPKRTITHALIASFSSLSTNCSTASCMACSGNTPRFCAAKYLVTSVETFNFSIRVSSASPSSLAALAPSSSSEKLAGWSISTFLAPVGQPRQRNAQRAALASTQGRQPLTSCRFPVKLHNVTRIGDLVNEILAKALRVANLKIRETVWSTAVIDLSCSADPKGPASALSCAAYEAQRSSP